MAGKLKRDAIDAMASQIDDHNQAVIEDVRDAVTAIYEASTQIKSVTDEQGELQQVVRQLGQSCLHQFNNQVRGKMAANPPDKVAE